MDDNNGKTEVRFFGGEVIHGLTVKWLRSGRNGTTFGYVFHPKSGLKYLCVREKALVSKSIWEVVHIVLPFEMIRDQDGTPDLIKTLKSFIKARYGKEQVIPCIEHIWQEFFIQGEEKNLHRKWTKLVPQLSERVRHGAYPQVPQGYNKKQEDNDITQALNELGLHPMTHEEWLMLYNARNSRYTSSIDIIIERYHKRIGVL
jgi:hypothetical protein